jgi:hypothetical protein
MIIGIENLQILCPNCHRQKTSKNRAEDKQIRRIEKYGERNLELAKRKMETEKLIIDKETLEKLVWLFSITLIARNYRISRTTISRRCILLGINKPPKYYWNEVNQKIQEETREKILGINPDLHGKVGTYNRFKCRCNECSEAKRIKNKMRKKCPVNICSDVPVL